MRIDPSRCWSSVLAELLRNPRFRPRASVPYPSPTGRELVRAGANTHGEVCTWFGSADSVTWLARPRAPPVFLNRLLRSAIAGNRFQDSLQNEVISYGESMGFQLVDVIVLRPKDPEQLPLLASRLGVPLPRES